ncbi:hypothetical protein BJ508DRAFT_318130 [Ascobolus immersus RN42]|uniref:DAGKc domain-containing protein n=1 Tax=Ascobolus immersus RN42 TaxID=1160509 RepID=A0A3N4I9P5_ASCIM|nr:hypothetical protein BJ508DRAFT_318130 [Ascobolus immersus RN42]
MSSSTSLPVPTATTMLLSREASSIDGSSTMKGGVRIGGRIIEVDDGSEGGSVVIRDKTEPAERRINFYDILYAEVTAEGVFTIDYVTTTKTKATPQRIELRTDQDDRKAAEETAKRILERAYGDSPLHKRLLILINPFGGTGAATKIFNTSCLPLLQASRSNITVQSTTHSGHATEIAKDLDISAYDGILCCSGDGLPHEVYNGLAARPDAKKALQTIAVAQLPGGSGNAMCHNLTGTGSPSLATLSIIKSTKQPIDLVSITQGTRRIISFLSQSLGIVAEADLATEHLRWMGDTRFVWGVMQRLWRRQTWPCELAVKVSVEGGVEEVREHYRKVHAASQDVRAEELAARLRSEDDLGEGEGLPALKYGTVNDPLPSDWELVPHPNMGNFYAGNMAWVSADALMFPASLPHEGCFDLVTMDGTLPRMEALKIMGASENGKHWDMDHVLYRKVLAYRIVPTEREGYVSVDGERIPFERWQAEVHHGLGRVWARGAVYQNAGV